MTRSFWSRTLDKGLLLLTIVAVSVLTNGTVPQMTEAQELVTVCHKPGTTDERTIQIDEEDVQDHLKHGDRVGACDAATQLSAACQAINGPENTGTRLHVSAEFLIDTFSYEDPSGDWFAEGETIDAAVLAAVTELPEEAATEKRLFTLYYTDDLIKQHASATTQYSTFKAHLFTPDGAAGRVDLELTYLPSNITSNEVTVAVTCSAQ